MKYHSTVSLLPFLVLALNASPQPQQGCDCEPAITGEASDGANVSSPINSSCLGGTWTAINEGELEGYCVDCDPTHPKQCRIDYKLAVQVSSQSCGNDPESISWLGEVYVLGNTDPNFLFSGFTAGLSFSLDCGDSRKKTVKLLDANGSALANQAFEFGCIDCSPGN